MTVDEILAEIDGLTESGLLLVHREVCRRAARVYGPMYASRQQENYRTAMFVRDTRFVAGRAFLDQPSVAGRFGA